MGNVQNFLVSAGDLSGIVRPTSIVADSLDEVDETFTVTIAGVAFGISPACDVNPAAATTTITIQDDDDAAPLTGTVVIVQDTRPDGGQDFSFTGNGGVGSFSLDDDGDATLPRQRSFTVPVGSVSVEQSAVSGFDLVDIVCVTADVSDTSSPLLANGLVTIDVDAGETITCTFSNRQRGSITIQQVSSPKDPQDFRVSLTGAGVFALDDASPDDGDTAHASETTTASPGTYTLTQQAVTGWSLTSVVCTTSDAAQPVTVAGGVATVVLDAAEQVTCTFTTTKDAPPPPPPTCRVSVGDRSVVEGTGSGTTTIAFPVTRTGTLPAGGCGARFTLTHAAANGTNGADFQSTAPMDVVITSSTTSLSRRVVRDSTVEPDERFVVTLSPNPAHANPCVIGDGAGDGTIVNDDAPKQYGKGVGWWKNHTSQWPSPYSPSTTLTAVGFVAPSCSGFSSLDLVKPNGTDTLLQALRYGGGSGLQGKARNLLRQAVAGLLNEQRYGDGFGPYASPAALIGAVNATLATCNQSAYAAMADALERRNDHDDDDHDDDHDDDD